MSMLSSALAHLGIPKGVQQGAVSLLGGVPGVGTLVSVANAASKLSSPFTGVVAPGSSSMINRTFGLENAPVPAGMFGDVQSSSSSTAAVGGGCPRGYHLNKHALAASHRHGAVGPRQICVRNRHVNALNGRAASRALRRLKRANKMTRKIHALFHHPARKAPTRKR